MCVDNFLLWIYWILVVNNHVALVSLLLYYYKIYEKIILKQ